MLSRSPTQKVCGVLVIKRTQGSAMVHRGCASFQLPLFTHTDTQPHTGTPMQTVMRVLGEKWREQKALKERDTALPRRLSSDLKDSSSLTSATTKMSSQSSCFSSSHDARDAASVRDQAW